jgi:5,5'-dehydrodivanillate O-demethylase
VRVAYEPFEFGIIKKRLYEGDTEDSHEWTVGHPLIFPVHLLVSLNADWVQYQFRLPVDDTNTIVYWYDAKRCVDGEMPTEQVPIWDDPWQAADGSYIQDNIHSQDMMVWISQGPITDHTLEHLGESDRGVTLYRRILLDQVARVEQGLDPDGLIRDPARNTPFMDLPVEKELRSDLSGAAVSNRYAFPEK